MFSRENSLDAVSFNEELKDKVVETFVIACAVVSFNEELKVIKSVKVSVHHLNVSFNEELKVQLNLCINFVFNVGIL